MLGFSETIIYSGSNRSFDIGYLNPILNHVEVEGNNRLNRLGDSNSNAVWQLHIDTSIKNKIRLSFNYLIDEFVFDPDIEEGKENGIAYSFRVSKKLLNHRNQILSFNYNYIHIGTPTFRHGLGTNNFINNFHPLGYIRGSDLKEFSIGIEYLNKARILISSKLCFIKIGEESITNQSYEPYKDYQKGPFPSGEQVKKIVLNSNFDFKVNKNIFLVLITKLSKNDIKSLIGITYQLRR